MRSSRSQAPAGWSGSGIVDRPLTARCEWHTAPVTRRGFFCAVSALLLTSATLVRADQADDYIRARMDEFHVPGLSIAILKDGKIVKAAGYGLEDVDRRIAAAPETVYKIGSVSKQFIAAGIMLLAKEGRLAIDDPLRKHLDEAPSSWQPITIRQLLTHTSGLVRESPGFDPMKDQSDIDVVRAAYASPLLFEPGAKWTYSNVGYQALAEIITRVSRRPWPQYLHDQIFRPAGMRETVPTNMTVGLPSRARGYTGTDNRQAAEEWVALRPSGAFLSTVLDLAKWDRALSTDSVLSEEIRREMWTQVRLNDGSSHPYGFGWHVNRLGGRRIVRHGGGLPGFAAEFTRFVDDGVSIVALANGNDVDLAGVVARVALFYLPK